MATNLHVEAPLTLAQVHKDHRWLLPAAAVSFVALAVGAALDRLPWDRPIAEEVVAARSSGLDRVFLTISAMGSTRVVLAVAALGAALAWRRCPRLAIAIVVIALARPLTEFALKELIGRDRPAGDRLVPGNGPSFPSGHPLATAASWGLLPLVAALYTQRRIVWWTTAVGVWVLAVAVAASRVWLGVHWTSDVVAALLLAMLGVAAAERFVRVVHEPSQPCRQMRRVTQATETLAQAAETRVTTSILT